MAAHNPRPAIGPTTAPAIQALLLALLDAAEGLVVEVDEKVGDGAPEAVAIIVMLSVRSRDISDTG